MVDLIEIMGMLELLMSQFWGSLQVERTENQNIKKWMPLANLFVHLYGRAFSFQIFNFELYQLTT